MKDSGHAEPGDPTTDPKSRILTMRNPSVQSAPYILESYIAGLFSQTLLALEGGYKRFLGKASQGFGFIGCRALIQ